MTDFKMIPCDKGTPIDELQYVALEKAYGYVRDALEALAMPNTRISKKQRREICDEAKDRLKYLRNKIEPRQ